MKLECEQIGMGLIQAKNEKIILVGGMRSGSSSADVTRLRYQIIDPVRWKTMSENGATKEELNTWCEVGLVDLFVKDGTDFDVKGLVNIEINMLHRREGYARKVVEAIRHTTGNPLLIHDIKKRYASTWRKLGVENFHTSSGTPIKVSKVAASVTINGTMPAIGHEKTIEKSSDSEMSM